MNTLRKSLLAGAAALAFLAGAAPALAQNDLNGQVQAGAPNRPAISSSVDPTHGLYFSSNRTGFTGHLEAGQGPANTPTLSSCGAGALATGSTDAAGTVTLTGVTACTINFGNTYAVAPSCVVFDQTTNRATLTAVVTPTTIPITGATAADVVSWICVARSGG